MLYKSLLRLLVFLVSSNLIAFKRDVVQVSGRVDLLTQKVCTLVAGHVAVCQGVLID